MAYGFCFYLLYPFNLLDPSSLTEKIVTSMDSLVRKSLPITAAYLFVLLRRRRLHYVQIIYSLAGRAMPVRVCGGKYWTVGQIKCRIPARTSAENYVTIGNLPSWNFATKLYALNSCHVRSYHLPKYPLKDAWRSEVFPLNWDGLKWLSRHFPLLPQECH